MSGNKLRIGVDFDDVLMDSYASLIPFHNTQHNTALTRDDITSWHLGPLWNCTDEEAHLRVCEWYLCPEHDQMQPMPGAVEAIARLAQSHELYLITSRPAHVEGKTMALLQRHFGAVFADGHFTDHFHPKCHSKAEVCRELGISLLIEDSLVHARKAAESGITVLLLDAPWNREHLPENIIRVFSWEEILGKVEKFKTPAT